MRAAHACAQHQHVLHHHHQHTLHRPLLQPQQQQQLRSAPSCRAGRARSPSTDAVVRQQRRRQDAASRTTSSATPADSADNNSTIPVSEQQQRQRQQPGRRRRRTTAASPHRAPDPAPPQEQPQSRPHQHRQQQQQQQQQQHPAGATTNGTGARWQSADDAVRGLVHGATVIFSDSAALRLRRRACVVWDEAGPRSVLIVKKPVAAASAVLREMADWLQSHGLEVFVERAVHATEYPDLEPFDPACSCVDLAVTLGGDGTVLHLASLFAEDAPLPPVMCFAMGSLGFLTPFDASQFRSCLARVLAANHKPLHCTLRTRKRACVVDADGNVRAVHHILNECVVDRGASPASVYLEVIIDGSFVTAAEADGLIIATPSGSTAYSMSAGGSVVSPSVPCTLITPLSPHSLSFRPLIIPENADLTIRLPPDARSHARASFDGKNPMRIARGQSVSFQTSAHPLAMINIGQLDSDFFDGLNSKLKWNQRIRAVPSALQGVALAAAASGSDGLGGLVASLATAAANEAKFAGWVEEALLDDALAGNSKINGSSGGGSKGVA